MKADTIIFEKFLENALHLLISLECSKLSSNRLFILNIVPVILICKQCFNPSASSRGSFHLEGEIPIACLSRKSLCVGQKNTGVELKAMLLIKPNLRNFSLDRLLFMHFLFNRILPTLKSFKAGTEIFKGI